MKKTIKLLSILLVAFILAGCGENNSKTENIQQEEVVVEKQEANVESEKEQEAEQENEQDEPELEAEVSHEPLEYKMAKIGTNEIKSTSKSALVSGLGKEDYTDVTYYNLMFVVDLPVSSDYSEYRSIRLINAKTDTEIKITGDIVYDVYNSRVPTDGELQKNKNNGSIPALLTQTDSNSLNTYIVTSLEPISFDDIKVVCDRSFDNRETWEENILEFNSEIEDIDIVREYTFGNALFSHNGNYYIVEGNSYSSGTGDGKKRWIF